jgi:GrpB-like predicted nucleotidyltransferase (UPF0157 family)
MPIVIVAYQPTWPAEFEALRASLVEILGPLALQVDHIGSTSVPGLGAKDVIDVQVTVAALDPEITRRMTAAGYEHWQAITGDHVPLGDDPDPRRWAKLLFSQPPGERRRNVQVRVAGNSNQRYALLFRDYLRVHPKAALSVELIKRQLARHHADDIEAYYDIKDPVYDLIWDAAQAWAEQTGWAPA